MDVDKDIDEQKKELKNKLFTILNIIVTIIAISLISAFSYAYFSAKINNSEETTTINVTGGEMVINYSGGPNIVLGQMSVSSNPFATKTFTVTASASISSTLRYNLAIVKQKNTFTNYGISYNLTSTNTGSNGTIVPSSSKSMCFLNTGTGEEVLGNGTFVGPITGTKVHTYSLKLYFPNEVYQVDNLGKNFEFYISIKEGTKTASTCTELPGKLTDTIFANNGGKSSIVAASSSLFNSINTSSENKMYSMADDHGTSYYFRGAKTAVRNNLIFANHQWKIIRINGDGSIRLLYNGPCANNSCTINSTGTVTNMKLATSHSLYNANGTARFNTNSNDAKYVGYMFGGANGAASTSRSQATTNTTNPTIKNYLDAWYTTNIKSKKYEKYVFDTIFCNNRQLRSEIGGAATGTGFGSTETHYAAYYKFYTVKAPNLKCPTQNDRFTTTKYTHASVQANKALTNPIGLPTADEVIIAGNKFNTVNATSYFYSNYNFWTMSPWALGGGTARISSLFASGSFGINYADHTENGVRGVINLHPNTRGTGSGTTASPYIVLDI